jgi:hypothetical protein
MEPEGSISCSHVPTTGTYPKPGSYSILKTQFHNNDLKICNMSTERKLETDISHIQNSVLDIINEIHDILNLNALSNGTATALFNPKIFSGK